MLVNLVTNAAQAIAGRPGTITITMRLEKAGSRIRLTVADTGCGMDRVTRERVFEPFFTTKEVGKGTGLGLAIVYRIVANHRGTIAVQSKPGKGARFDIVLPVVAASQHVYAA
jgi:two-component system NtrC family sensor kinase